MISPKINSKFKHFESKAILDIGNLIFFKKFVLLDINEGAHLGFEEMQEIHNIVNQHYKETFYCYLFQRETSYSVNPIAYSILNKSKRLKGIAIMKSYTKSHELEVERHFVLKPFEVFNSFEDASTWMNTIY